MSAEIFANSLAVRGVVLGGGRGETEIWDLNKVYAQKRQLHASRVDGWWSDVGSSIETYLAANKRYAKL